MARKIQFVFLLLCFLGLTASRTDAYTFRGPGKQDDQYLVKLISQYPEHRKIIEKLYKDYSGHIISLTEKYGEAPLLAMNEAKEEEYAALYRDSTSDVFFDIYQTMASVKPKSKRAYLALRLTNAMNLAEQARGIQYNLLSELKAEPDKYAVLLQVLTDAAPAVLESIAKYPNAFAFLCNAGPEGVPLIAETNGEIIPLSYVMTHESQAALPALFKEHHLLAKALASCKADAFPVIMETPDFYFALASSLTGEVDNPYFVACAILDNIFEAEKIAGLDMVRNFLNDLPEGDTLRIARHTAELMAIFNQDTEEDAPLVSLPFNDPYFIQFVHKYDRAAADVCAKFGEFGAATLLMKDWEGASRDISPVVQAISEYTSDYAGLLAAFTLKDNKHMQGIILSPKFSPRNKELFMFMFYDLSMNLSAGIGRTENSARKLLDDYIAESGTGRPIDKGERQLRFREFVPGYDLAKPIYDMIRYGKTPTVGELAFAAIDAAQFIPILVGTGTLIKSASVTSIKQFPGYAAKKMTGNTARSLASVSSVLKGGLDDSADAIRKLSLQQVRKQAGSIVRNTAKTINVSNADVFAITRRLRSSTDTLSDLWRAARKLSAGTKSAVVYLAKPIANWADDVIHLYPKLRASPELARRAVIRGLMIESALEPTVVYAGAVSLLDYLESKQLPLQIVK